MVKLLKFFTIKNNHVVFLLLVSGTIKELKSEAVPFVSHLVRHCTIVGLVQQAGPCPIKPQAR